MRQPREDWIIGTPEELIHRRRRQVLVHSILYYRFDCPVLKDWEFDEMARDLARLQKVYPEASDKVLYYREAFSDFNGETGYHLPLSDYYAMQVGHELWRYHNKIKEESCNE